MRKLIFTAAMVVFTMLSFTSCEEMIVSSDQTIDLAPKATLSGNVLAELNMQSAGFETVPAGTELFVEVSYADINAASDGKWMDTIQVSADGKYSVQVPADANGVTVSILPFAFVADQTQAYGSMVTKVTKTYSVTAAISKSIASGQSILMDVTYDKITAAPSFVDKVKITGEFTANLDQQLGGNENVPNGTVISFYNASWKDSAVVTNGKYSIAVPKSTALNVKSKFTYSKKVWNETTNTYSNVNYEYKYETLRTFSTMDEEVNIVAASSGEGTDLTVYPIVSVVSGTAVADLDENFNAIENMPNGTVIKFWTETSPIWGINVTVSAGQYTVNAPKDQAVYYSTKFNYAKNVEMIDPKTSSRVYVKEDYQYTKTGSTMFSNDKDSLNLSAGTGVSINPTYIISGKALVELDDTKAGLENIPDNVQIKYYYPNSNGSIINRSIFGGLYSISVPKGRNVSFSGTFIAIQKVGATNLTKTFTIAGSFTADGTKTVDVIATVN